RQAGDADGLQRVAGVSQIEENSRKVIQVEGNVRVFQGGFAKARNCWQVIDWGDVQADGGGKACIGIPVAAVPLETVDPEIVVMRGVGQIAQLASQDFLVQINRGAAQGKHAVHR